MTLGAAVCGIVAALLFGLHALLWFTGPGVGAYTEMASAGVEGAV